MAFRARVRVRLTRDENFHGSFYRIRLQLPHRDPRSGYLFVQCGLQRSDQFRRGFFVAHLNNDLRIARLGSFGRDGEPETWSTTPDETRHGSKEMLPRFLLLYRVRRTLHNLTDDLRRRHFSVSADAHG